MPHVLIGKSDNGVKVFGFIFTDRTGAKLFRERFAIIEDDPEDNIKEGNFTEEELSATLLVPSMANPEAYVLWAPLSTLEVIDAICGDAAHEAHSNARIIKLDPSRRRLAPGYLADARKWSAMELAVMQAIAQIKGKGL